VNPYPYDHKCQSSRRVGKVKHTTKFWIREKIKDWLAEDPTVRPKKLRRRLKDDWKVSISYKKVYDGKALAMEELYGNWHESFDNLYKFKAQIEQSCPDSFVIIDHHTIEDKIRFNRLFLQ
jgi:hypothetical protein